MLGQKQVSFHRRVGQKKAPKEKEKKKITVYEPLKPTEVKQEEAPISGNVVVKTDQ